MSNARNGDASEALTGYRAPRSPGTDVPMAREDRLAELRRVASELGCEIVPAKNGNGKPAPGQHVSNDHMADAIWERGYARGLADAAPKTPATDTPSASALTEAVVDWIKEQADSILAMYRFDSDDDLRRAKEAFEILRVRLPNSSALALPEGSRKPVTVWFGAMPESNGNSNWTALLLSAGKLDFDAFTSAITLERSEFKDRVRYVADRVRFLLGEIDVEPDLLDYDENLTEPASASPGP